MLCFCVFSFFAWVRPLNVTSFIKLKSDCYFCTFLLLLFFPILKCLRCFVAINLWRIKLTSFFKTWFSNQFLIFSDFKWRAPIMKIQFCPSFKWFQFYFYPTRFSYLTSILKQSLRKIEFLGKFFFKKKSLLENSI